MFMNTVVLPGLHSLAILLEDPLVALNSASNMIEWGLTTCAQTLVELPFSRCSLCLGPDGSLTVAAEKNAKTAFDTNRIVSLPWVVLISLGAPCPLAICDPFFLCRLELPLTVLKPLGVMLGVVGGCILLICSGVIQRSTLWLFVC
jgi:hypothetical protein